MKHLSEFIRKRLCIEEPIMEMATLKYALRVRNADYKIALHGVSAGDRDIPHFHIYLTKDIRTFDRFNFEISLVYLLRDDDLVLVAQIDKQKHIRRKNKEKCSWDGYADLKYAVEDWLEAPSEIESFKTNLHRICWTYDEESGPGTLRRYLDEHSIEVLQKYKPYIP